MGWVEPPLLKEDKKLWGVDAKDTTEEGSVGDEATKFGAGGGDAGKIFYVANRRKISVRRCSGISISDKPTTSLFAMGEETGYRRSAGEEATAGGASCR